MKKIYCRPVLKVHGLMPEKLMGTDTTGNLTYGNGFGARRDTYIEEEDEEEITKSVRFDD